VVFSLLESGARLGPDRLALVCGRDRLTYGDVVRAADQAAAGLQLLGVGRGDRVAVCLESSWEAVVAIFAIARAGAVFVPIGRTVKAPKLSQILTDCAPVAIVADARMRPVVDEAMARAPGVRLLFGAIGDGSTAAPEGVSAFSFARLLQMGLGRDVRSESIDLDLAALIYTSGSSGRAKGVMLSHANILSATASINSYLQNTPDDVILDVLPLSFDYGLYQLFLAFSSGARLVLERAFTYPSTLLDLITRERVTALPIVPTLAALLARHNLRDHDLSSLRYVTNTGAPLPSAHIRFLRTALPQVEVFSMYGLTECKRVSFLPPSELDARPDSVGKPMDNVEVFVADETGRLSPTGIGELVVRGSNVMSGYWNAPEPTNRVLKPGPFPGQNLLFTGDRFRIDDDGYMYFEARLDDVLKCRGQRVSPKEVENVLYEITGVIGASVFGIPDDVLGTAVKARVQVDRAAGLTEQVVLRYCASRLEDFMVPKEIEFVDHLPTTESGKILRRQAADDEAGKELTS
jgi:long-chain acyl-CoA synthetase